MKVLLFGATGMVGDGVLHECLTDPRVNSVLAVGRSPLAITDPKLQARHRTDFFSYVDLASELATIDACFFCLGVSSVGMRQEDYYRQTFDLTLAAACTRRGQTRRDILLRVWGRNRQLRAWQENVGAGEGEDRERAARATAQSVHVPSRIHPPAQGHALEDALVPNDVRGAQSALSTTEAARADTRHNGGEHRAGDDRGGYERLQETCAREHRHQCRCGRAVVSPGPRMILPFRPFRGMMARDLINKK